MVVFLIILFLLILFRHTIARLLGRFFVWLTMRQVRKQMGMPPGGGASGSRRRSSQTPPPNPPQGGDTHIIPPEYAEDVEFVEIKEFSSATITEERAGDGRRSRVEYAESQVSDVEWEEVRR